MPNGLSIESQEWAKSISDRAALSEKTIATVEDSSQAQVRSLKAALSEVPRTLDETNAAIATLSVPVRRNDKVFNPNLAAMPANTWTQVARVDISAPTGKSRAEVLCLCTPRVYGNGFNINNTALIRLTINGTSLAPVVFTPEDSPFSNFVVASRGLSGTNLVTVVAEVYNSTPSNIRNDTTNPNYFRISSLVVWS